MSAPQTSVATVMPIGSAGQLADLYTEEFGKTMSAINAATESLAFGTLAKDNHDGTVTVVGATSDDFAGVVIFDKNYDYPSERDDFGPLPNLPVQLLRKGNILVIAETAVAPGNAVHVRIAAENRSASNPLVVGAFRATTAGAGDSILLDPNVAQWKSTTTSTFQIAELEIDLPEGTKSTPSAD